MGTRLDDDDDDDDVGAQRDATLTSLLRPEMVDWAVLDERYHALLQLVDALLGVVPNCDRYLEIWPPAFRTYNVMVPNLLNLPVPVFGVGGPPPAVVGLAMYVASRTAGCSYCSAHSCSFAMRRGAGAEMVAAALLPGHGTFGRGELAVIAVARSLARVPGELTAAEKAELIEVFGERHAEWIVLAVVMMGFLNKFMDAIGVELEQAMVDEPAPPPDRLRTKLRLLPLLPAAIRYDRRAQRGTPSRGREVGGYLAEHVGHDFPALAKLRSNQARRAIATMLRENLDPATSVVGVEAKVLAGAIFAAVVGDEVLAADVGALARHAGVDRALLEAAAAVARGERATLPGMSAGAEAVLALALAASPSPARVEMSTVEACERGALSPAAVVEVVTWLAVLQLLHRLTCYTATG